MFLGDLLSPQYQFVVSSFHRFVSVVMSASSLFGVLIGDPHLLSIRASNISHLRFSVSLWTSASCSARTVRQGTTLPLTLAPTAIVHFLPLKVVQGHDQVLLGCEGKGPCDPENNTNRTNGIGIGWRCPPIHRMFPYGDCFHEL